jgi:hypothetical protein
LRLASRHLFSQRPQRHFSPIATGCRCGADTCVLKTQQKSLATLAIGQFEALETQRHCPRCGEIYRSEELRALSPQRGQFGFDVIAHIGRALFVHCRSERAVQAELTGGNIPISISEISFLGKRFIVYLALAHRACQGALREHMAAKGGYILHLDATGEGDSPPLFSCLDEIGRSVLGNRKMPTEDSAHLILLPAIPALKNKYLISMHWPINRQELFVRVWLLGSRHGKLTFLGITPGGLYRWQHPVRGYANNSQRRVYCRRSAKRLKRCLSIAMTAARFP